MPEPRETPLNNELLPGHTRFTVYAKYTLIDVHTQEPFYSIEELDIDANNMQEAIEFACHVLTESYNPGWEIMTEHTATRYPGEMYF